MAKKNASGDIKKEKVVQSRSPFKDADLLDKEVKAFINKFKATVKSQASRMSDYFEMSCFNYIVKYYQNCGYTASIQNLQAKKRYRYKCSPSGIQSNYSFLK